jgi:hypothetical protein
MFKYEIDSAKYTPFNNYRCANTNFLHGLALTTKYDAAKKQLVIKNLGNANVFEIKLLQTDGITEMMNFSVSLAENGKLVLPVKVYKNLKYIYIQKKSTEAYKKIITLP